jgi:hypothetical protein
VRPDALTAGLRADRVTSKSLHLADSFANSLKLRSKGGVRVDAVDDMDVDRAGHVLGLPIDGGLLGVLVLAAKPSEGDLDPIAALEMASVTEYSVETHCLPRPGESKANAPAFPDPR